MRLLTIVLILTSFLVQKPAFGETETEQLKRIVAIQNANLARLEAALKTATARITALEVKQTEHSNAIQNNATSFANSIASLSGKWNGLDLGALQKIQSVGDGGVRIRAAPFVYDFRESGTVWFWKDGESVESITIQGNYEATQICRAHGRNCVRLY